MRNKGMRNSGLAIIVAGALAVGGCATTTPSSDGDLDSILSAMGRGESRVSGGALNAALEKASAFPLGSAENPVRAHMPPGQRAYLSRLRCENLRAPEFTRAGSAGLSPYGNIVDLYIVTCPGSAPEKSEIFIDMYHSGYAEDRAVPGFGIAGGRSRADEAPVT